MRSAAWTCTVVVSEPQAREGACSSASQIGHVTTVFGDGPNPLTLPEAGKGQDPVYLTGPYEGAPFGLSIVVPAEAGPFNLGKVVVRAKVLVDPLTARISVVSDPLPTILQGVLTDVRTVNVQIDRERFTFNPTNCELSNVIAQVGASNGENATVIVARVPSAGRLVASGKGLSSAAAKLGKAGTATLALKLSKRERLFLARHHGRKLKVNVKLLFTPAHGGKLSSSVTVLMS